MILKRIRMGRPRSGRLPFLGFGFREGNRSRRRLRRVEKWETGLWFSTFPSGASWGGGNVEIWRSLPDFQGTVERGGNRGLVFPSFHGPVISTARERSAQRNRGGGRGDSILQARSSLFLAALIFLANSVSLMVFAI